MDPLLWVLHLLRREVYANVFVFFASSSPEEIGDLSLFLPFSPEKRRFRTHLIHPFVYNWFLVAFQKGFLVACQQSFTP